MGLLAKSSPELQGISSEAIAKFIDEANETLHDLHSMILMRHGQVVAEGWWAPYEPNDPHIMFSLSKSFTSTAVGLAVDEGKLKVTDSVISFFPEEAPVVISPNLAALQVRHLLSMTTGQIEDTMQFRPNNIDINWAQAILSYSVECEPGSYFMYNTGATYLLSAIVQKVTGQTLLEYLEPRLFAPLGIENPGWEISPQGISTGGFGLAITTEAIARFGQLYLQEGIWEGKRLVSQEWIKEATAYQVPCKGTGAGGIDWEQGYGYQFWRSRHGGYRGDGAFGQFCLVMPDQDAVLAITAGVEDTQAVLNLVWKHLLPAMETGPLPENLVTGQELATKLEQLELVPLKDGTTSSVAAEVSGRRFVMAANDLQISAVSFNFDGAGGALNIESASGKSQVAFGNGHWQKGVTTLNNGFPRKVAASGGWANTQTFLINLYFLTPVLTKTPAVPVILKMPFGLVFNCRFEGDLLIIDLEANVALGGTQPHRLQGRLA